MLKNKYFTTLVLIFNLSIIPIFSSFADKINTIVIEGNERITDETVIGFLPVKIGDNISSEQINLITKDLYNTNFFENISVSYRNETLLITLNENPIIQKITYNGINSDRLKNLVTENLKLIDRSSFIKSFAEQDETTILNNLKKNGYYFSKVFTKVENLDDNKVNIFYDIELGKKAKINKISFIGEKIFKDKVLKNVILSEEYKFWKFISGKKYLNEGLVDFDKRLLRNFYLNKGYYNVKISSSFAKVTNDEQFELIYNINSGEKIFFGDFKLNIPSNYDESNFSDLIKTFNNLKDEPYSINSLNKITSQIDLIALYEEYETIKIDVVENIDENLLNIEFIIQESEKNLISKINVFGNNITRENVIRNQFEIDEGDFYNEILFNKTINNLKSLNFFKNVNADINQLKDKNEINIDIIVEEKSTGEIGASAGGGTNGGTAGFYIKENNYLGKGLGLNANLELTSETVKGLFSITNPNYNDTDKKVYLSLEASETDKLKDFGYKTKRTGFSYGTNFEFLDDLEIGIGNSNYLEKIDTNSTASALQNKQKGNYFDSFLNLNFAYDKRNQNFRPTDGYRNYYGLEIPLISDNNTLSNIFDYKYYTELYDDNVTMFAFYAKASNSLTNDNIKLSERNFIPFRKLRGFESGRIGPKDGKDFIGGNYASAANIATSLPGIFKENQNIDFNLFFDAANVWGVDYNSSLDNADEIRSSIGINIDWLTTLGPLNFSVAQPITKSKTDVTETFRFNIGTSF
jgi:outer membrane protein insertion porin family